jgi:hypothetical protein
MANGGQRSAPAVRSALTETADKVAGMAGSSFHPDYGFGRLNLEKLIQRAQQGK